MKTKQIIYVALIFIFSMNLLSAQEDTKLISPDIDKKCNDLIIQLNAVIILNSDYVRKHELTFAEYGEIVAKQLIKYELLSNISYDDFTSICLYPYSCFLKSSDYDIVEENMNNSKPDFLKIKCCKPKGIIGDAEGYFYFLKQDYMDYFSAAMQTIGKHTGYYYDTKVEDDIVYTIISK